MSGNHLTLIYRSDASLYAKLLDFFAIGIDNSERCVLLTSKINGQEMFNELKTNKDSEKVVKLFSYFSIPDPVVSSEAFEEKISNFESEVDVALTESNARTEIEV